MVSCSNAKQQPPISLLQDKVGVDCTPQSKASKLKNVKMDARDENLFVETNNGSVQHYKAISFLDFGVLFKSKERLHTLFHVWPNGKIHLNKGLLFTSRERNCEDLGAAKTCTGKGFQSLYWSPEKIGFKAKNIYFEAPVILYGYFPNDATYFYAKSPGKDDVVVLIDYGSRFEVLVGKSTELFCQYQHKKQ
jgi:hypothetical protein